MMSTATMVLALRLIGSVVVLAANLVVVRLLGASQYGAAVFIISAVNIFTVLSVGGSKKLLIRNIGMLEEFDVEKRSKVFSISLRTSSLLFVPSAASLAILVWLKNSNLIDVLVACLLLSLVSAKVLSESYLLGRSRPLLVSAFDNVLRPITHSLILVFLVLIINYGSEKAAYLYSVMGTLAVIVLCQLWLSIETSLKSCSWTEAKEWLRMGVPFVLISASLTLQNNADIVMLGFMRSDTDAGLYSVASRVSTVLLFGLSAVNLVYAPIISRHYRKDDFRRLQNVVAQSSLLGIIFAIFVGVVALLYSEEILLVFGAEFVHAKITFQILVAATLISAFCGPVGTLFTMTNFAGNASQVVVGATILNIILNFMLIPEYGVLGAGVATFCSLAFWNITMLVLAYKKTKVACGIFAVLPLLRMFKNLLK